MRKYRASRFKQLIFPQELIIDKFHVLARKRHFPAFWRVTEESIPLSKLASIQLHRGLFFSKIIIENSGGPYPIIVDGLWNRTGGEARDLLEMIEREMQHGEDVQEFMGTEERPPDKRGDEPDGPGYPPPPRPSETKAQPAHVSSSYQPESTHDREKLERIARDIVEEDTENRAPASTSPMAAHFDALHDVKESIQPPSRPPSAREDSPQARRVGDIPENWSPPPPWAPKKKEPEIEPPGYREIDPAEFLNSTSENRTAVEEIDPPRTKTSTVGKLVNWWRGARDDRRASRRKRRELK